MGERRIEWTQEQQKAILGRGRDVLVTASAGTGKTAVLSGRCVEIVRDKRICPDVLSVLVVTFTEAAAEQMQRRIAEQLRDAFAAGGQRHVREQLMLLQGADISTIHSFCKRLITEHFYELGLDPTFRVIGADEQKLLKGEALEKTIEWAWQQSNLVEGLEQLLRRRDLRMTEGFLGRIIDLSNFLDGVVSRKSWYERATVLAERVNGFSTDLGARGKQMVGERLREIAGQVEHACKIYEEFGGCGTWAAEYGENAGEAVARCIELYESGAWDECVEAIRDFEKPRVRKPKTLPVEAAKLVQKTVRKAMDSLVGLRELAVLNADYVERVAGSVGLQTKVLIELVRKFEKFYDGAKRAANCADFADLEHYALELLSEDADSGELRPSETALSLRKRYKYVFVDEYQDINPVQEGILRLIGGKGNIFVVGDVKQSIYAFRGAEPGIFVSGIKGASRDAKAASGGLRIDLTTNFRSAEGILEFVNKVFGRIMTVSFGGMAYDESAKLKAAAENKSGRSKGGDGPVVELHILDEVRGDTVSEDEQRDESTSAGVLNLYSGRQRQAAVIARRIREMVGAERGKAEFEVYDKQAGHKRPVEYGDIVILMRSPYKRANDYVEILRQAGVPVSCEGQYGYFEATEISDCLCLLKVLDNPRRDIELAAVLRGAFFKLSDTELAKIKVGGAGDGVVRSFYDCVVSYGQAGGDLRLAEKVRGVLERLDRWRGLGRRGSLGDLVWQIYRESGVLAFVSALPNGRRRKANLLKLHDRAIQFEGFASSGAGSQSLGRFVDFIEKISELGEDWGPAEPEAAAENAVRIMSVHKSKGLEFAVVFLTELDSQFNKRDSQGECLADSGYALGLQVIDRQTNSKLSSLAHQVIAAKKSATSLAEEMRILYVAMTRAKERLILTACKKAGRCRDIVSSGIFFAGGSIPDWQLRACGSAVEWILYGVCDEKSVHDYFETGLSQRCRGDVLFDFKFYGRILLERLCGYLEDMKKNKSAGSSEGSAKKRGAKEAKGALLSEVRNSLGWRYGFSEASLLPAKLSVSEMTHGGDEYIKMDCSKALERKPKAVSSLEPDLEFAIDGRLRGTATHLVISKLDLARPIRRETVERTLEELLDAGRVNSAVAERIDTDSIVAFFKSELGRGVLDCYPAVWREWPFSFSVPASVAGRCLTGPGGWRDWEFSADEMVIVQGIIDMVVRRQEGLVIIDFKTDNVRADEVSQRAESYRGQLELYGRAAGAIVKAESVSKWVYFLTPGCAVEV